MGRPHSADRLWPSGTAPEWLRREVEAFDAARLWERGPEAAALRRTCARIGRAIARRSHEDLARLLAHAV